MTDMETGATLVIGKPTPSQRNVLYYTALGLTAYEISRLRGVSAHCIKNHRIDSYVRLGVYNTAEAISLLMVTDQDFFDDVKKAILEGAHKPDSQLHGRGEPKLSTS